MNRAGLIFSVNQFRFIEKTKADLEAQSKRPKIARVMLSDRVANALDGASNTLNDIIRDLNVSPELTAPEVI